jgi:hypothetical protein
VLTVLKVGTNGLNTQKTLGSLDPEFLRFSIKNPLKSATKNMDVLHKDPNKGAKTPGCKRKES